MKDKDLADYSKLKEIVLKEFQPTPISCLENFRKACRNSNETFAQFSSRLIKNFEYFLKLGNVSNFETLKHVRKNMHSV